MDAPAPFDTRTTAIIFLVSATYFVLCFSPLIVSSVHAALRRQVLPRRVLFVTLTSVICYGVVYLLSLVVIEPISAFLIFVAPQLEHAHEFSGGVLEDAARLVVPQWWFVEGIALVVLSFVITRALAARWARIVSALAG